MQRRLLGRPLEWRVMQLGLSEANKNARGSLHARWCPKKKKRSGLRLFNRDACVGEVLLQFT
jgi:hypothetical protein